MIDIRHVSQQVELTFWSVAIESMSAARQIRGKFSLPKIAWQVDRDVILKCLAISGLGVSLGFLVGFAFL